MINLKKLGYGLGETKRNQLMKRITVMMALVCMYLSNAVLMFADDGTNFGEKIGKWVLDQFFWIFVAAMLILVCGSAIKRAYTAAVITFVIGCVGGFFIKNPGKIETLGKSLGTTFGF